jgi:hypothetical protein
LKLRWADSMTPDNHAGYGYALRHWAHTGNGGAASNAVGVGRGR